VAASDLPQLLKGFDGAARLPRLGGMARPDGVVVVSERFWAFACVDGTVREGSMPQPPRLLQRVPLARGLIRLGLALAPLLSSRGAAGLRERLLVVAALVLPLGFVVLPSGWQAPAGIAAALVILATLLRGRALALHGAEHRAIAAVEQRRLEATWDGRARPSRFSPRCGTNFAAIALPTAFVGQELWPLAPALWTPVVVASLSLALSMELWRLVQAAQRGPLRILLVPGLALQRLTTREPRPHETRVALTAVAAVLRRELA
jgi:Protein of unknown function (DUF1385)